MSCEGTATLSSIYLDYNVQSTLVISNSKGLLKYFEISVPRHIKFAELRKKYFEQPHLTNICVTGLLKFGHILKILWKREEKLLLRSNFSSFPQYLFYLLLDFHV